MGQAKQRGSKEDRKREALRRLPGEKVERYFGYREAPKDDPFGEQRDIACIISMIAGPIIGYVRDALKIEPVVGEYIVSTGGCDEIEYHGPFKDLEEATDYTKDKLGIVNYGMPLSPMFD